MDFWNQNIPLSLWSQAMKILTAGNASTYPGSYDAMESTSIIAVIYNFQGNKTFLFT